MLHQQYNMYRHLRQIYFLGSQELVYISHIIDPHNFYVQRASYQTLVKEMLHEFKNAENLPKPSISHATEGKLILHHNYEFN